MHVKHIKVFQDGQKYPEIFIEAGFLHGLPFSKKALDVWYSSGFNHIHQLNEALMNECVIFLIGIARFDREIWRLNMPKFVQIWDILVAHGIVELKEHFDSTKNKE